MNKDSKIYVSGHRGMVGFAILRGDMSVVGPRPVMSVSFAAYPEDVKKVIYNVKPGLTGIV